MPRFPGLPAVGPFAEDFWRSPLRGPWLASLLSAALLPLLAICLITGLLSHLAYQPRLGSNALFSGPGPGNGLDLYSFAWPTSPSWLYAVTQGLHVVCGFTAIPILLAKLWTVIPKLFENPPARSIAHALERFSLALLVGGGLFTLATGVINIQLWYPFGFPFVAAHYYGAIVFSAALALHVGLKVAIARRAFAQEGIIRPLRADLARTEPERGLEGIPTSAPHAPAAPTLTRRALVGGVGVASLGLGAMAAGQVIGGPLRELALLAPRGRAGSGPNGFPVNKTFAAVGIPRTDVGDGWRLLLTSEGTTRKLSRPDLLREPLVAADLPIACVEGWSTTQRWQGVRLLDLARLAGVADPETVEVRSLQPHGRLARVTLNRGQVHHPHGMLALRVNGAELSLDHGYPARIIVPALPGVHCTKWVGELRFT